MELSLPFKKNLKFIDCFDPKIIASVYDVMSYNIFSKYDTMAPVNGVRSIPAILSTSMLMFIFRKKNCRKEGVKG